MVELFIKHAHKIFWRQYIIFVAHIQNTIYKQQPQTIGTTFELCDKFRPRLREKRAWINRQKYCQQNGCHLLRETPCSHFEFVKEKKNRKTEKY